MRRPAKLTLGVLGLVLLAVAAVPLVRSQEHASLDAAVRSQAPGRFIQLSNGVTHYDLTGPDSGQTVVLVHGFSVPYYIWDPTFRALAGAGFRVLRYDLFGRGYSDRPAVAYTRQLFEAQLLELVDSLHLRAPVDLVGLSMGGTVVAGFTAAHPDLVRRVVLIDPAAERVSAGILGVPLIGDWVSGALWAPRLAESQLADFYQPDRFPDWPDRYREQMHYRGFRRALLSTVRHFMDGDPITLYQAMAVGQRPVLLIWGAGDRTVPSAVRDRLREAMHPEFMLVDSAGHIPHLERPELVNPRIVLFLGRATS